MGFPEKVSLSSYRVFEHDQVDDACEFAAVLNQAQA